MFKLFFVVLIHFNIILSLVRDPRRSVGPRQFVTNKQHWYDYGNNQTEIYIAYQLDEKFSQWEKQYIRDQFKKLTTFTCLKSLEYAPNKICDDRVDCIHFFKQPEPTSCELDFRRNEVNLTTHCFEDKWVLHEILHALGFGHEHQRSDRDCYVIVSGSGLTDPKYVKDEFVDISFPYDVHSIMHYRMDDRMKQVPYTYDKHDSFGSKDELTEMDIIAINYMYCRGKHYCDLNPMRCEYFRCWIECNPCSDEPISQCSNCTGNTY